MICVQFQGIVVPNGREEEEDNSSHVYNELNEEATNTSPLPHDRLKRHYPAARISCPVGPHVVI